VYPKELAAVGIRDYRQAVFKPWRVVYRVIGDRGVVYLIVDGRRDMQTVLARRLLGARPRCRTACDDQSRPCALSGSSSG